MQRVFKYESYETKNDYRNYFHCCQSVETGYHLGLYSLELVYTDIRATLALPIGEDGKRICCSVHYGGDEYVYRGETFHGARLNAFCGGIRMDMREAVITEDEEIDIHTFCGGIEIFVPTTVNVEIKSQSFIGGVGNHAMHTADPKAPTLHIVASNFLGGVDIKN